MKLTIIGTGYVGLVSGACLADVGNTVVCVDKNADKVTRLKGGHIPIYEPGLAPIVERNIREGRLLFESDIANAIQDATVCFIAVDTPTLQSGESDTSNVFDVAHKLGQHITHPTIVAIKSTVPVGTTLEVKRVIADGLTKRGLNVDKLLQVAFCPEFLKEGDSVNDFMKPDRIIVGAQDEKTIALLHELYRPFMLRNDRFIPMSIPSAELTKYAANCMLATRVSFMNEFARLAELVGADIGELRHGLGSDSRIGPDFLYPGLGFGGSCLPKDTQAITKFARSLGARLNIVEAVVDTNQAHREWFFEKIVGHFGGTAALKGCNVAIWGLSYKANTDDLRSSPALYIIDRLSEFGARQTIYDPVALERYHLERHNNLSENVRLADNIYSAVEGADCLVVCTEWREFRNPDFARIRSLMKSPVIFDGRNLFNPATMKEQGFTYFGVGCR